MEKRPNIWFPDTFYAGSMKCCSSSNFLLAHIFSVSSRSQFLLIIAGIKEMEILFTVIQDYVSIDLEPFKTFSTFRCKLCSEIFSKTQSRGNGSVGHSARAVESESLAHLLSTTAVE